MKAPLSREFTIARDSGICYNTSQESKRMKGALRKRDLTRLIFDIVKCPDGTGGMSYVDL